MPTNKNLKQRILDVVLESPTPVSVDDVVRALKYDATDAYIRQMLIRNEEDGFIKRGPAREIKIQDAYSGSRKRKVKTWVKA